MKYEILKKLKQSKEYVSGELLSKEFQVTRTVICYKIKELKDEGYQILASSKKGYKYLKSGDIINSFEVSQHLNTELLGNKILYFTELDSTNNYVKKLAIDGHEEGTLVIADAQTSGRGRLGREWNSPKGKGIYMSFILKPNILPRETLIITLAASLAIAKAIEKLTNARPKLKWPNDVILDNKKVCGILTELSIELDKINFLVMGIGLNVHQTEDDFPEDLKNIATSLKGYTKMEDNLLLRSDIIKEILREFEILYKKVNEKNTMEIINEWKKYSLTLGREVSLTAGNKLHKGIARDISSEGKLVLETETDGIVELFSGEASIRGVLD